MDGADPATGLTVRLYNPRVDLWEDHFVLDVSTAAIAGQTDVGRATAQRLKMNDSRQIEARRLWILLFGFPAPPPDPDRGGVS